MTKKCNVCNKNFPLSFFLKHRGKCKFCRTKINKKYRQKNIEKEKIRNKKWYQSNILYKKEKGIKYREKNKIRISEYHKKYKKKNKKLIQKIYKNFLLNNPNYSKEYFQKTKLRRYQLRKENFKKFPYKKLQVRLRSRLSSLIKKNNWIKGSYKLNNYLCCSFEFLKQYLEKKFYSNMTWDNYGKIWHIDHIIPLYCAKNIKETYILFHYTNLQPLLAKDNLKKGHKNETK